MGAFKLSQAMAERMEMIWQKFHANNSSIILGLNNHWYWRLIDNLALKTGVQLYLIQV